MEPMEVDDEHFKNKEIADIPSGYIVICDKHFWAEEVSDLIKQDFRLYMKSETVSKLKETLLSKIHVQALINTRLPYFKTCENWYSYKP